MSNHHQIFVQANLQLVNTLAVKFDDAGWLMNEYVIANHGSSTSDPTKPAQWKYYQNLAGRHHATDEVIVVNSLDKPNNPPIEFTKKNLKDHPVTRTSYLYGTRHYVDLLARYPSQRLLINGVLYAPDDEDFIDRAIAAPDGTYLYWDERFVEEGECNLMEDLQQWSYQYVKRWINPTYTHIDQLYPALYIGQHTLHTVQKLLSLRSSRLKTPQTHSYYIREYLRSHGVLDEYIAQLTREQTLFLYRNIRYIEANAGKQETLDWLIENIMTKRGLPVYEHTLRHDVSNMIGFDGEIISLKPKPIFQRKSLNMIGSNRGESYYTAEQIMRSMNDTVDGNADEHFYHGAVIEGKLENSDSNVVKTKILESIADDITDVTPYSLQSVLINHLYYYVSNGVYTPTVDLKVLGTERSIFISAKEALALATYCWLSYSGLARKKDVNGAIIETNILPLIIPELLISHIDGENAIGKDRASLILDSISSAGSFHKGQAGYIVEIGSPQKLENTAALSDFYTHCEEIHRIGLYLLNAIADSGDFIAEVEMENWVNNLYTRKSIELLPDVSNAANRVSYERWIADKGFFATEPSLSQLYELGQTLLDTLCGGISMKASSIKDVQRAMIQIMRRLSSYTIHFISDVDESDLTTIPNSPLWVGGFGGYGRDSVFLEIHNGTTVQTVSVWGEDCDELFEEDLSIYSGGLSFRIADELLTTVQGEDTAGYDPLFDPTYSHTELEFGFPISFTTIE